MKGHVCIGGHVCTLPAGEIHACENERCLVQHFPRPKAAAR